jgi:hypothetical protein
VNLAVKFFPQKHLRTGSKIEVDGKFVDLAPLQSYSLTGAQSTLLPKGFFVPKKYLPFSDHTSPQIFGRLNLLSNSRTGTSASDLSLEFRIFLVGLRRLSNRGHAPFGRGELAEALPILDTQTGELRTYSDRQIRKKIKVLVIAGLFSPESSTRCLIYPLEVISLKTSRGSDSCPEHGTHRSWSNEFNN